MRKAAVIVGVLFWISNLATLVGSVIAGTIPNPADALTGMYPRSTQVVAGTLVAHVNDVAIIGYALMLFTVLKQWSEALALGYVVFKALEATLLAVSGTMLLSLIGLSQQYLATGAPGPGYFEPSVTLALSQQFWAARLAALAYLVATPMLNVLLYRSQLVPRVISIWGFVALVLLATGLAVGVGDPTRGFQPGQLLVIPIILWELLFATWLIVRGFRPSRAAADPVVPQELRPLVPATNSN
jgi:Domain of unknown function (DUF4386)